MFGSLKEKLKNWLSKTTKPEEKKEESKEEKKAKKEKTKKEKKAKTPKLKKAEVKNKQQELTQEETEEETLEFVEEKTNVIEEIAPSFVKQVEEEKDRQDLKREEENKEQQEKKGFFSFFKKEFTQERFEELFSELELILLQNNVASSAVDALKEDLKKRLVGKHAKEVDLTLELREAISSLLINPPKFIEEIKKGLGQKKPFVIVFAGINGSGKTTTIAKVAHLLLKHKLSVCLAAADTFRAASIEQLQQHAHNLGVQLIKKDYGSDPAAVGFDAVSYAKKHHIDVVLIDTAGRMQNKDSLMREMEKIVRVNKPDMKIFLGESITGNDATQQASAFNEVMDLTGIILSKADVDEKGGTAISVTHVTGKPILFLGTGQTYDDLEVFSKEKLIEKLGL